MKPLIRVVGGLLGGGILYSLWLALYLGVGRGRGLIEAVLWLLAPIVTAIGFAGGVVLAARWMTRRPAGPADQGTRAGRMATTFWRVLPWPLVGCAIGALAIYWYGPMLIVFTMFMGGVLALTVREGRAPEGR
jgi:hypothetical protein